MPPATSTDGWVFQFNPVGVDASATRLVRFVPFSTATDGWVFRFNPVGVDASATRLREV